MRFWLRVSKGLRALFNPGADDRDVADEVRHYLEEATAELVADGATPEEARRTIRLRHGDGLSARDEVRTYGWENLAGTVLTDLRLSLRRLRRSPGFTAVVVLTLGLGIGAATAIFSAVNPVLFRPLDYPDADRILAISSRSDDGAPRQSAFAIYRELTERNVAFEHLSVLKPWQPAMSGEKEPERLEGQRVSAGYFDVLGVRPALGPGFETVADRPGGPNLVVLSDGLWRRRFGADPAIIGQAVRLDAEPYSVVGVMPPSFENVTSPSAEAWALMQYDPSTSNFNSREWGHHLDVLGRSAPGVRLEEARQSLNEIAAHPIPEFSRPSWGTLSEGFLVQPLRDAAMAGAKPTMVVLLGAVALLLVIACANVTILMLARSSRRQGELAMRAALGAGRRRLVQYLLTESLILSVLGGAVGIVIARFGLAGLVAVTPASIRRLDAVGLDATALGFAIGLTTLVGLIFGLTPAFSRFRGSQAGALWTAGRGSIGRTHNRRRALVATEVALAMVLLVGAGLLLRSTQRLFSTPPGFDPKGLVVMQVPASGLERGDASTHRFFDQALDAVRRVPGVTSAVLTSQLPLSGDLDGYGVTLDEVGREGGVDGSAYRYAVAPGYLETMGIRLVSGRALDRTDIAGAPRVIVVSQTLASRLFPGRDPIGERLRVGATELPPYTIVGVVDDVKQASLETDETDGVYITSQQWHWADRVRWIAVKADVDPIALVPAIRSAVWSVNSDQPIVRVQSMESLVARSEALRRFVSVVLMAFALMALTLSGIGLYGVLSGTVSERMRELGVRAALGASQENILALVVRQGVGWTALGVMIGLVGAALASGALITLLFGVSRLDPATYLGVIGLLMATALLACWIPAARAARVDPMTTLRADS